MKYERIPKIMRELGAEPNESPEMQKVLKGVRKYVVKEINDALKHGDMEIEVVYDHLDNLPIGLIILDCSHNELFHLDNLQPGLQILYCWNNKLTQLYDVSLIKSLNNK